MKNFHTKKKKTMSYISIPKISIYLFKHFSFLFLSFYFHKICRFCFPKNTKADNICKVI